MRIDLDPSRPQPAFVDQFAAQCDRPSPNGDPKGGNERDVDRLPAPPSGDAFREKVQYRSIR
jgi:hypothetical protein